MSIPSLAPLPPTELPEAVRAQLDETRDVLHRAAASAGVDVRAVDDAINEAAAGYAHARVHAYVGILVERAVRERLGLRSGARPPDAPTA